jgi:hypothetical protein
LFKEIIAVYNNKHMKPNTKWKMEELMIVEGLGTHNYHWVLNG